MTSSRAGAHWFSGTYDPVATYAELRAAGILGSYSYLHVTAEAANIGWRPMARLTLPIASTADSWRAAPRVLTPRRAGRSRSGRIHRLRCSAPRVGRPSGFQRVRSTACGVHHPIGGADIRGGRRRAPHDGVAARRAILGRGEPPAASHARGSAGSHERDATNSIRRCSYAGGAVDCRRRSPKGGPVAVSFLRHRL